MITLSLLTHIYLYSVPCDMRKSFDGLCGLVRSELGVDPLSGSLFVFMNRRRNMVKLLYWDMDGLALWFKRLEQGLFTIPANPAQDGRIERRQLAMLLEGIVPKKLCKRYSK